MQIIGQLLLCVYVVVQTANRELTPQDGWNTQDGRMKKKCRERLEMHSLALHFFLILPSGVFQPSCCVSSLMWSKDDVTELFESSCCTCSTIIFHIRPIKFFICGVVVVDAIATIICFVKNITFVLSVSFRAPLFFEQRMPLRPQTQVIKSLQHAVVNVEKLDYEI